MWVRGDVTNGILGAIHDLRDEIGGFIWVWHLHWVASGSTWCMQSFGILFYAGWSL